MRVEIRLSKEISEPYVEIHAGELTPEIQEAVTLLESLGHTGDSGSKQKHSMAGAGVLIGHRDERMFILPPESIQLFRTENGKTCLYDDDGQRFVSGKRLYELEEQFDEDLVRISKSAIIRIKMIDHVEQGFGGALNIVMRNSMHEYISRRFLAVFKARLGL